MKSLITTSIQLLFVAVFFILAASSVAAQISLPTAAPYTQNFDGLGTSATATLPANWKVDKLTTAQTVGTFAAAGMMTELSAGNNMSSSATNGIYNYGAGVAGTATDRAVGWISANTAGALKSGNLYAQFMNDTGRSVTSLSISYDVEKYRNGSNAAGFRIQMFYSFDGTTWTAATANFLTSFPADANNNGFASAPGATVSLTNQVLQVTIPDGSNFYLAWNYSVTSGTTTSNAQALGIDNFSIIVNTREIVRESTSSGAVFDTVGLVTTLSFQHTVGSGTSRFLLVGVSTGQNTPVGVLQTITATYQPAGDPMATTLTAIGTRAAPLEAAPRAQMAMFKFPTEPPSGTGTVTITVLPGVNYLVGGAASFSGVSGHRPFVSSNGSSSSPQLAVSSVETELVVDTVAIVPDAITLALPIGSNQTELWNGDDTFGGGISVGAASTEPGATSVTMSWNSINAGPWSIGAISLIPVSVTAVELASFTASQSAEGVLLEWTTGYEVDNLGFNIYREAEGKRARITPRIVAGSALLAGSGTALTAGRQYRWFDPAPGTKVPIHYWLEEIDLDGKVTLHGPVTPVPSGKITRRADSLLLSRLQTDARGSQIIVSKGGWSGGNDLYSRSAQKSSNSLQTQWDIAAGSAVKITVNKDGWYRVAQPALVAAGLDPSRDPRFLRLFTDAQEMPILIRGGQKGRLEPTDAIEFYAATLDTPSTDRRVYWLTSGQQPGRRITILPEEAVKPTAGGSFPHTVERKERSVYFAALINGEAENFFGPIVTADPVAQEIWIDNLDKGSTDEARLEVALQGVTDVTGIAPDHNVKVRLNGVEIGSVGFDGQAHKVTQLTFSNQLLREGSNSLTLVAEGGEMDVTLIDYLRLTYAHTFRADGDALQLGVTGGEIITITGFSQPVVRVLDITDPNDVQELASRMEAQGSEFAITVRAPAGGERRLAALTENLASMPFSITANRPSTLNRASNGANFIIITHGEFAGAMEPLKRLRQGQGLSVSIVDVEDIYDEFSYGAHSPQAIKEFLARATTVWKKRPGWVMFAGDASFDPRDYLGLGESDFVPTKLIDTSELETASDDWFVDFNSDGLPEMAVGRLPVRTVGEADRVIEKIIDYAQASRAEGALMVADRNDGYDFEAASASVKGLLPAGVIVQEVFRGRVDDATAKQQIIEAASRGPKVINYLGHGSVGTWRGNLLTSLDAAALQNAEGPSLFVLMTCLNGFFHDPYGESLAESLMKCERGGAVAVWASSALTMPGEQTKINRQLYQNIFASNQTLGEAAMRAKIATSDPDIRRTWILFGDPTSKLK
jgi:hypothetical protein